MQSRLKQINRQTDGGPTEGVAHSLGSTSRVGAQPEGARGMATHDGPRGLRRTALLSGLHRAVALIILLATLGTALGVVLALHRAQDHVAEATILISPLEGNPYYPSGRGDELINLETEAELVRSDSVGQLVADAQGTTLEEATAGLQVSVPPNTQILTIDYTSSDRLAAVAMAQSFADEFLRFRQSRAMDLVARREAGYREQIADRNKDLKELVKSRSVAITASARALIRENIQVVTSQLGQLRSQVAQLQATPVDPGQVVSPATIQNPGSLTTPLGFGLLGLAAGAGLGVVIVMVRARSENRIHNVDDIEAVGLPVIGRLAPSEQSWARKVLASPGITHRMSDELRAVRVALLTGESRRPFSFILACGGTEMRSPTSGLSLALAIALTRLDVVLVDATDGAHPIASLTPKQSATGLTDVLNEQAQLSDVLVGLADHLRFLPAGQAEANLDDLLMTRSMSDLIETLKVSADVVIVVTTEAVGSRTKAMLPMVDGLVVEVAQGQVRLKELGLVLDRESDLGAQLSGVVFTERSRRTRRPSLRS